MKQSREGSNMYTEGMAADGFKRYRMLYILYYLDKRKDRFDVGITLELERRLQWLGCFKYRRPVRED